MSIKYAFMREFDDGRWGVAIVGNIVNKRGELLDFKILPNRYEADTWRLEQIGDGEPVYTHT